MTDKPKLGRPSTYTPELAAKICLAIATHDCSIKKLHAKYDWFPDCSTIYNWLYIHGEIFSTHYWTQDQNTYLKKIINAYLEYA